MNIKTFIIIQCMIFYKDELYQTSSYIKLHQDVILEIKYIYKLFIYYIYVYIYLLFTNDSIWYNIKSSVKGKWYWLVCILYFPISYIILIYIFELFFYFITVVKRGKRQALNVSHAPSGIRYYL